MFTKNEILKKVEEIYVKKKKGRQIISFEQVDLKEETFRQVRGHRRNSVNAKPALRFM